MTTPTTVYPSSTARTFLSTSLAPGSTPEPAVTSREFLWSFLEYGCWLRPLAARGFVAVLENMESTQLQRLSALTSLYQTAGQVVEDTLTAYVSWSIWAANKERSLPDIVGQMSFRMSVPAEKTPADYVQKIQSKLASSKKRVDIYPREYLTQLLDLADSELPGAIGIAWKKHPSSTLVPARMRPIWDGLGTFIRQGIQPLTGNRGAQLATTYNKIKHGPQLTVQSLTSAAVRRGHAPPTGGAFERPSVRLLFDGSRVEETAEEVREGQRISPFLIDDVGNARRWFHQQLFHNASALFQLGTWLYNTTFSEHRRPMEAPPEIRSIADEQRLHLHRVFNIT